jgi:K+ transporter
MPATINNQVPTQMPNQMPNQASLADIHLPETIANWPIAPGWWIVLFLSLVSLILLIIWIKKRSQQPLSLAKKNKQLKKQAQQELELIKQQYQKNNLAHTTVKSLSVFLRRYVLSIYNREQVASITDKHWLKLLDNLLNQPINTNNNTTANKNKNKDSALFSKKFALLLTQVPYQSKTQPIDNQLVEQLLTTTTQLIKQNIQTIYPITAQEKSNV